MTISLGDIAALILSGLAIAMAIFKGRQERASLDANASDQYAAAAGKLAEAYDGQFVILKASMKEQSDQIVELKQQLKYQDAENIKLKRLTNDQQIQLDAQSHKIGILEKWVKDLCDQIKADGGTPVECPAD